MIAPKDGVRAETAGNAGTSGSAAREIVAPVRESVAVVDRRLQVKSSAPHAA
jgi:hypothetical protein